MKPKDLKALFTFDERKITLEDGVFYMPDYMEDYGQYTLPSWQEIFGNEHPVALEFCAGNGAWVQERAQSEPTKNWVAVEKRFDRIRKIWAKKKNHQLDNLLAVCGEGHTFTTHYVPSHSVAEVYVNFPDPWPKKRHAKHRIMKESFIEELARVLERGGRATFVTADKDYLERTDELFIAAPAFGQRVLVTDPKEYGNSYFDSLWREKGRTIYYVAYCRK